MHVKGATKPGGAEHRLRRSTIGVWTMDENIKAAKSSRKQRCGVERRGFIERHGARRGLIALA